LIKTALINFVKSGPLLGFRTWLVKLIITEFFEEIAEPLIRLSLRRLEYSYKKVEGKIIIKKIEKAKNENNQNDYDHSVDDIFN